MAKSATPKSMTAKSVVSLKVTLREAKPPIWRRVLVPGAFSLGDLSDVILSAMGWVGGHLHTFDVAGRDYGVPGLVEDVADENRITLNGVLKAGVKRFTYTYDLGDNWDHVISVEKTGPAADGQSYPLCVAGKRHCPPDDCGGAWDMPSSWRSSPTAPTRNAPSASSGWTTKTSTLRRSTSKEPTAASPPKPGDADQSEPRRARGPFSAHADRTGEHSLYRFPDVLLYHLHIVL